MGFRVRLRFLAHLAVLLFVPLFVAGVPSFCVGDDGARAVKPGDVQECFAHQDRCFAQAMAALPRRAPWRDEDRAEILRNSHTSKLLGDLR